MNWVLVILGVVLVVLGIASSDSISSELAELFAGSPSSKSIWLMVGGVLCMALGFFPFKGRG